MIRAAARSVGETLHLPSTQFAPAELAGCRLVPWLCVHQTRPLLVASGVGARRQTYLAIHGNNADTVRLGRRPSKNHVAKKRLVAGPQGAVAAEMTGAGRRKTGA